MCVPTLPDPPVLVHIKKDSVRYRIRHALIKLLHDCTKQLHAFKKENSNIRVHTWHGKAFCLAVMIINIFFGYTGCSYLAYITTCTFMYL